MPCQACTDEDLATLAAHGIDPDSRGCGGAASSEPCGGCDACIIAQVFHSSYEWQESDRKAAPLRNAVPLAGIDLGLLWYGEKHDHMYGRCDPKL